MHVYGIVGRKNSGKTHLVTRLVRAVVLSVRDLPYVEAARSNGTRVGKLLRRHILPSTVAPLIVQATYICASAILTEAGLSFLGAGTPPEFPTWGNMIASSRLYLQIAPWTIFAPGICLALVVLAVVVYLLLQRYFVSGLLTGAVK